MVLEINSDNFANEVLSHNGVVVVDFFANWCGPCRKLAPILEEVDNELSNVKFAKINTDENIEMAKKYQVSGLPTLMVFKNGIGRIEDRRRDAHTILSRGQSISLKENFLHYDFKDLDNFIGRYNWYATREAMDYISTHRLDNDELTMRYLVDARISVQHACEALQRAANNMHAGTDKLRLEKLSVNRRPIIVDLDNLLLL